MKNPDTRILSIRLSALGDVAMTLPVVYSLARQYPEVDIILLTRPFFARLFINRPNNITLVEADYKGKHKGVVGTIKLLKELSALKVDKVADLHNVLRSWIIDTFFILKGKKVAMVDKTRNKRKEITSQKKRIEHINFIDRYINVFDRLGYRVDVNFKSLFEEIPAVSPINIGDKAVGIAPFARFTTKTYPVDQMEEVVKELTNSGIDVYLFGARGKEAEVLNKWQEVYPNCTSLAGKFSIEEELAIISKLNVMLTMDSANQHLSSLAGTPAITIWGGTTPACGFLGYKQKSTNAMCLNLDCQPCSIAGGETCPAGTLDCMKKLSSKSVVEKIKSMIKQ